MNANSERILSGIWNILSRLSILIYLCQTDICAFIDQLLDPVISDKFCFL